MANTVGVSVLFTDLVGSTALASEVGPAEAEQLRLVHFGLLRGAIDEHGGREVKNLGDGVMAVFPGASAALAAAVAMQQAFHRHNAAQGARPLEIRIGVATGDCTEDDGDYFGEPVVQAARLCAEAGGGEILATAVFRMLVPRDAHDFEDVGALDLKGLPEPVPAVSVGWEPGDDGTSIPLQARLTVEHLAPLVGRDHEREVLRGALKAASAGQRSVVLVTGEAGLGKTRLTSTFAAEAADAGATVLYGRCDEELAVPYLPWVESLGHYVDHAHEASLAELDEATIAQLLRLLPGLHQRLPGVVAAGAAGDQYALVAAVTRMLVTVAAERTTVVLLDDLHWADDASLLALRHIASSVTDARLLVIGTYRETDLGPDDPLTELSATLHRVDGVHRLALGGLSDIEVVTLVEAIAGHDLDEDGVALAHSLRSDAAGNPFFVTEVLRHLAENGDIVLGDDGRWALAADRDVVPLPQSVRDVVGQRVRRLGAETHGLLTTAAVVGREFDADVVAGATDLDEDDVLDHLEGAMAAGLIAEVPHDAGRFTFTHALVQHTLYEEVSATRRARLHRRVAEAIEAIVGDRPGSRVGELAQHWFAAVRPLELDRAISYAVRAGERALEALAPAEAVRWFSQAFEAVGDDDLALRAEVLVRLGDAERRAGRQTYRERLLEAAALADRAGRDDIVIEAAIHNYRGTYSTIGDVDAERVAVLESALRHDRDADPASRARLLATLAGELVYGDDPRRVDLAREATTVARSVGDDDVVLDALERIGSALNIPELLAERDAHTQEAMGLTSVATAVDPVRRFFALDRRAQVLLELADMDGCRRCSDERREIAERLGEPTLRWLATYGDAALDLWEGKVEASRAGNDAAFALGLETGQPDTLLWFAAHAMQSNWHCGQYEETLPLIDQAFERAPSVSILAPVHAVFLHNSGRVEEARSVVARFASTGLHVPRDLLWLTTNAIAGEAVCLVGDTDSAAILHDRLMPFADHVAVSRGTFQGAVSYYLGLLARALGRPEAEAHLLGAIERNGRLRTPFHRTRALVALAELVRDRQPERSRALATEAAEAVERHGIGALRDQVQVLAG